MLQSKKAAFISHADPDVAIRKERRKRQWFKHSVAVLVVSPRVDRIVLALPVEAVEKKAHNVRVPPQKTLLPSESVLGVASNIVCDVLNTAKLFDETCPMSDCMQYLGSTRGNAYCEGTLKPYAKWVHWVGAHLDKVNKVFNKNAESFAGIQWCTANQLLSMSTIVMSDRKYLMTLQALAAFSALGIEGAITYRAHKTLAA